MSYFLNDDRRQRLKAELDQFGTPLYIQQALVDIPNTIELVDAWMAAHSKTAREMTELAINPNTPTDRKQTYAVLALAGLAVMDAYAKEAMERGIESNKFPLWMEALKHSITWAQSTDKFGRPITLH
jgi:hypothetical protein